MYAVEFTQVGSNIQRLLKDRGITQQSLAKQLGVSKQVINKIIKGNKAINVTEIARIAEIIGISIDELLTVESELSQIEKVSFMGSVKDEQTRENIELIQTAIDEIYMLEELLNG